VSGPEASSPLQGRREGRIEIVTLNRPAQRNAMSAALVDELTFFHRGLTRESAWGPARSTPGLAATPSSQPRRPRRDL
jgi:hypothetical protein